MIFLVQQAHQFNINPLRLKKLCNYEAKGMLQRNETFVL